MERPINKNINSNEIIILINNNTSPHCSKHSLYSEHSHDIWGQMKAISSTDEHEWI